MMDIRLIFHEQIHAHRIAADMFEAGILCTRHGRSLTLSLRSQQDCDKFLRVLEAHKTEIFDMSFNQ